MALPGAGVPADCPQRDLDRVGILVALLEGIVRPHLAALLPIGVGAQGLFHVDGVEIRLDQPGGCAAVVQVIRG